VVESPLVLGHESAGEVVGIGSATAHFANMSHIRQRCASSSLQALAHWKGRFANHSPSVSMRLRNPRLDLGRAP
jgi:hypothetical protein